MAIDVRPKNAPVRSREIAGAPMGGRAPAPTPVSTPVATGAENTTTGAPERPADLAKIGVVAFAERQAAVHAVEIGPVRQGGTTNARALLVGQVQTARLGDEQRKFLKGAYKELASSSSLPDHLAMRALAAEQGVTAAFDEIMRAHADRLLPELLQGAHVFAGGAALAEMQEHAHAMGGRAAFDEALGAELALALGWAKTDGERDEVNALAARLGLTLSTGSDDVNPTGRAYEASPKHHAHAVQGGFVSPAPTNGQQVLDGSVQVKPESPRRVGVDKEAYEYVVFDETVPGTFHGHTRTWDQLHPDMQRALVAQGACTNNGRML